jgi:hypothetical protein
MIWQAIRFWSMVWWLGEAVGWATGPMLVPKPNFIPTPPAAPPIKSSLPSYVSALPRTVEFGNLLLWIEKRR